MFEQHRLRLLMALALPVVMAGAGLWAQQQLPAGAQVPIHFNAAGLLMPGLAPWRACCWSRCWRLASWG